MLVWPRVRDGNWDIALLDLESGEETPLTTSPLEDTFPVLTHDRRTIIYNQVTEHGTCCGSWAPTAAGTGSC